MKDNTHFARLSLVLLWLALVVACGRREAQRGPIQNAPVAPPSTGVKHYSVDQIGEVLGGYLPPLDDGRLHVAPPAGWRVRPRSSKYLVRFVRDPTRRSPLPQITITAAPADFEQPYDLDEEALLEFQDLIEEEMSPDERKSILEPIKLMVLGDVPCLRYVVSKGFRRHEKTIQGECQVVKTLHAGRIYTVSLDVYRGTLIANKNRAYVVVAGMEFLAPDSAPEENSPAEATATKKSGSEDSAASGKQDQ